MLRQQHIHLYTIYVYLSWRFLFIAFGGVTFSTKKMVMTATTKYKIWRISSKWQVAAAFTTKHKRSTLVIKVIMDVTATPSSSPLSHHHVFITRRATEKERERESREQNSSLTLPIEVHRVSTYFLCPSTPNRNDKWQCDDVSHYVFMKCMLLMLLCYSMRKWI